MYPYIYRLCLDYLSDLIVKKQMKLRQLSFESLEFTDLRKSPLACLHEEFEDIIEAARISVTLLDNRI